MSLQNLVPNKETADNVCLKKKICHGSLACITLLRFMHLAIIQSPLVIFVLFKVPFLQIIQQRFGDGKSEDDSKE